MARGAYIGVLTDIPIYEEQTQTVAITADNIADYFAVTNGSTYYFAGSGSTFTSNNGGKNSSTATTVLTANQDISALSFNYSYSSEANYDKFTLKVAGTTVENAVSGSTTSKSYSGSLTAGQTIEFTYAKDSSQHKNDDKCTFSDMSITFTGTVQVGTETKSVARKAKKGYIGIEKVSEEVISLATADSLQDFWRGYYEPLGDKPVWNEQLSRYEFPDSYQDTQDFRGEVANESILALSNNVYFISEYYPEYYAVVYYMDFETSLSAEGFNVWKRETQGIARKIKKAYIGIGGVARPCWSGGELAYYGQITSLSFDTYQLAATSVGNYALFGGGQYSDDEYCYNVDAYSQTLVRTSQTRLDVARSNLATTTVGDYALFAGGYSGSYLNNVDSYNSELVHSTAQVLSSSRRALSAERVGDYALFCGGRNSNSPLSTVDVYNSSLTKTSADSIDTSRQYMASASVGDYALFAGGTTSASESDSSNVVDSYNSSLVKTTIDFLSVARTYLAGTSVGNFALFGGGSASGSYSAVVDAYNSSLVRSTPTDLSVARYLLTATSVEGFALFMGGVGSMKAVDAYNSDLVRTIPTALSIGKRHAVSTSVGHYALIGGGVNSSGTYSGDVEAYTVN